MIPMADPGQLLTVAEIAPELKMNQQTIPNWVGEVGRLTAMPTTLKLGACAPPKLLSRGEIPLIQSLGRQVWAHCYCAHIGAGDTGLRGTRSRAGGWI